MSDGSVYDADYFLRGKATGKSLYEEYRWLPDLTLPMVSAIAGHLDIKHSDMILDFGCARGYVVRGFRELGYNAYGYDVSKWALDNADPTVYQYLTGVRGIVFPPDPVLTYDWVVAKDVLEHVPEVASTVDVLMGAARKGVFAVVPLSAVDGGRYVVGCYERDVTHIHRATLATWAAMFIRPGWRVECSYRVRGVKDNYWRPKYQTGNGFITCRRVEE